MKKIILILLFFTAIVFSCKDENVDEVPQSKLLSNNIFKINIDDQGVKWIATDSGLVSYYNGQWKCFSAEELHNSKNITALAVNSEGVSKILMGKKDGGVLAARDNNLLQSVMYLKESNSRIASDTVNAVGFGLENAFFFGTKNGLSIFKDNAWDLFIGREKEEILNQYTISAIETAKDNWTYATTLGGGVSRFKYVDGVSGATTFTKKWASGLKSDSVYTVVIIDSTNQWFGTTVGASLHMSPYTKNAWTYYSKEDGLAGNRVYAIAKDKNGKMWFGTNGGLSVFDGSNWKSYTTADGLVDNTIVTLAVDLDNSIWIGTAKGISQFIDNKFVNYTVE